MKIFFGNQEHAVLNAIRILRSLPTSLKSKIQRLYKSSNNQIQIGFENWTSLIFKWVAQVLFSDTISWKEAFQQSASLKRKLTPWYEMLRSNGESHIRSQLIKKLVYNNFVTCKQSWNLNTIPHRLYLQYTNYFIDSSFFPLS